MKRIFTLLSFVLLSACSVTSRLERDQYTSSISQLTKSEREEIAKESQPQILKLERDSNTFFLAPAETIDGEQVMSLKIDEVVVVSKMRSIPERNGEVTLDFVVTIPKELLGRSHNVVITPELHCDSVVRRLEGLTIRGALLDKVQQRDYWQYNRYVERFDPSESEARAMFLRLVKFPKPTDSRLDSLVENGSHITYYYSQRIRSDETTKRMKITTVGKVEALDNSIYMMPPSDTLSYTISSMLSFLDTAPRFKTKIVDKYLSVSDTLGNNGVELDTIYARGVQLLNDRKYPQALYLLQDYADRNTIIAHLSMEHNQEALQLLEEQPADATTEYLRAIALSRLSRKAEGREAFLRACELEPRMEFRANLDPEITELLKQ